MHAITDPAPKSQVRDEAAMISKVVGGASELFEELVRPYHRTVFLTAYGILRNTEDAEDVSQESILKAFRHLNSFRGQAKFSTWLIQITTNEARWRLRREKRARIESLDEDGEENDHYCPIHLRDWREIPSDALENKELRTAIDAAMGMLPQNYREVLVLRDVQQLNIEETMVALSISKAQVKTRLFRARMQMRNILAPQLLLQNKRTLFRRGLNPWR
jgi:RNA polymerase sigma-70 factor (ECF subfamily)